MPWAMWMDADEFLLDEDRSKLGNLLQSLPDRNTAFVIRCRCQASSAEKNAVVVEHVQLFRNVSRPNWEYRVHEQILPSLRRLGADVAWTDVVVQHAGYIDGSMLRSKLLRNMEMLQLDLREHPLDSHRLLQMGLTQRELGEKPKAIGYLQQALQLIAADDSNYTMAASELGKCLREVGDLRSAANIVDTALSHCPNATELLVERCEQFWMLRDFDGAGRLGKC